jgi:DNA invertase Pin-like site-specific DNA recombinase
MRLVAYLRVSTHEQVEHGQGLDIQRAAIKRWAKSNGHRVVAWTTDEGVSGAKKAALRPGLTDALLMLKDKQAQGLVVRDLDRLAREITVQEAVLAEVWQRLDAYMFTAVAGEVLRDDPDDPMRTGMRKMVGVFHDLERGMIVKRLRDGRAAKAAKGEHSVGSYPYGWCKTGRVPAEQAALDLMLDMRAGGCSTREIAVALNAEGHPTKRKPRNKPTGEWSSPVVARILSRQPVPS